MIVVGLLENRREKVVLTVYASVNSARYTSQEAEGSGSFPGLSGGRMGAIYE